MTSDNFSLTHFGVKGMKWGVRRNRTKSSSRSSRKERKKSVKNESSYGRRTVKSVKKMSNAELKARINRMQLEKQYKQLRSDQMSPGKKFVKNVLTNVATGMASDVTKNAAGYGINKVTGKKVFKTRYGKS